MNQIPVNFDWVKARSECSISVVFEKLKQQLSGDVEIRNGLPNAPYKFKFVSGTANNCSVVADEQYVQNGVRFVLEKGRISVFHNGEIRIEATVTLCDDGECRLKVTDRAYELWQVRKMALEDLFFGTQ